ncbi:NADH dehydrogenase (ubiquinone) [Ectocarpus siliculosus]|uniref:NADH dehydrogenase (Ubiquinone) n=1 Tax=Ectocarpus siliculosus TaxID=2880 RepID=D8LNX6_ECTSI|nr:NADH dehydrogenase (ubiquinone) [Ectocarpus siliculosus]|eukprot:CBN78336.1 NADH dehydrogenase (ubiquinone) [Ectocarpus siliculosus]
MHSRSRRGVGRGGLKMSVQTPPKPKEPEFGEGRVADEELLSVIELAGRKAAAAGFLPVLGAKAKEEQDIMWKLKVSPEDVLAFADRAIDTAEDVFMHATRAFKPAARMNLPLQDGEDAPPLTATKKERIVVLGTGWGGHAISKVIDSDKYEVIYVSPRNYFVFTPMLAAASVGTVDVRSITEPIRMANPCVKYVSGEVIDIKPGDKKVVVALPSPQEKRPPQMPVSAASVAPNVPPLVHSKSPAEGATAATGGGALSRAGEGSLSQEPLASLDDAKPLMELSYDKLVYAVGTKTGTFGVPGVRENCYMLKEANDARQLRAAIVNVLEEACLPGVTDEEKRKLLSFVVIGAGPTGVEFTGELTDLIGNDVPRLFPELVGLINLTVVSSGKVLPMFEEVLQDRGLNLLQSQGIEILLGSAASEVTKEEVVLKNGKRIPYGLCFWAGGTEARPLTQSLIETIGPEQTDASGSKRGQITVDGYMRALGTNGTILALGDASSIQGVKMPTTGQVAAQEGAYVARLLNRGYDTSVEAAPTMTGYDNSTAGQMEKAVDFFRLRGRLSASPFHFINLGVLAYIGMGQAVAEVKVGKDTPVLDAAGKAGFFLWRSTYVVKQVSPRNRINVAVDWLKVRFFGRDITRL